MNPNLQGPLEDLAAALHRAIEDSDDVAAALAGIRDHGFRAHVLVEVTVALSSAAGGEADLQMGFAEVAGDEGPEWPLDDDDVPGPGRPDPSDARVSAEDREFLRAIRIRIED